MKYYLGIDIGGTFTDAVIITDNGESHIIKTPTTPANPSEAVYEVIRQCDELFGKSFLRDVIKFGHGTTIATNVIIEGRLAKVGLLVTRGFGDTLNIARIGREYLGYDITFRRPAPLVPRRLIEECDERVDYIGNIITPLKNANLDRALQNIFDKGENVEALAVCYLWSFKNPRHEQLARERIAELRPELPISISSEIAPFLGEYERMASTVINASLVPGVGKYLKSLAEGVKKRGLPVPLLMMQSNGGLMGVEDVAQAPVNLINSGPAGGVKACAFLSSLLEEKNVVGVDMGGTTFDVSMIVNGHPETAFTSRIASNNLAIPMIEITSIGAGGGSIAWADSGRVLKVGPQSAGSEPGPACYGRGGKEPTVTDADLLLGYLNPNGLLGGKLVLEKEAAEDAIGKKIAEPLGLTVTEAAAGIRKVIGHNMAGALRLLAIEKGIDIRDCLMIAFGGAGPLHAGSLCKILGIRRCLVPYHASVLSALGIAASDVLHVLARSTINKLDELNVIRDNLKELQDQACAQLSRDGFQEKDMRTESFVGMRFRGQPRELEIEVTGFEIDNLFPKKVLSGFIDQYTKLYGSSAVHKEAEIEIVTFRINGIGLVSKPILTSTEQATRSAPALIGRRYIYLTSGETFFEVPVYDRQQLKPGNVISGPAIIEQDVTTLVIEDGQMARVDPYFNILMDSGGDCL